MTKFDAIVEDVRLEFPTFEMVRKQDSRFMRILDVLVKIVTFGQMRRFMAASTTIGTTIYLSEFWDKFSERSKEGLLLHERVHMRQMKKYTLVGFTLLYLLVPIPFLFAYFRAKFEQEAYVESMRYKSKIEGIRSLEDKTYREQMIERFTTSAYGWMWIHKVDVEIWYSQVLQELYLEELMQKTTKT